METVLETLRQEAKCSMCNETPEELKILKCFHVFCEDCLVAHVELNEDGKTFNCPSCKTTNCPPRSGEFGSLTTSRLHSHILKVLSATASVNASSGALTCSCKKQNPPTSYCNNCARYFCEYCLSVHEMVAEGHRLLDLSELQNQDCNLMFRQQSFCEKPLHSKEVVKFYCNTCESCICQQCLLQDHQGLHEIFDLEIAAERQNMALQEKSRELETSERAGEENLQFLRELETKTRLNAEDMKTQVIRAAEELITFAEENKRYLIEQIDDALNCVIAREEEQECFLQQTRSVREHISKITGYANPSLVMNCKDSINERLEEVYALDANPNEVDFHIAFIPNEEVFKLQELGLGTVTKIMPADPLKSTVDLETSPQELEALNKVVLSVSIKSCHGETSVGLDNKMEVKVEPSEDVKNLQVSENKEGKCSIAFLPKVPGQFTVTVKIKGNHVCNSPMDLDVKPQVLKDAGEFPLTGMACPLKDPCGIAVNNSNTKIAITDSTSNCVAIFNLEGEIIDKISITHKGHKQLNCPYGVAFLNDNNIIVADQYNHRVVIFDTTTRRVVKCFGRQGDGIGEFQCPRQVHVDEQGHIIVCDETHIVQVFKEDGTYLYQLDEQLLGDNFDPDGIVSHGDLYIVSDIDCNVLHVVDVQASPAVVRYVIGEPGHNDGELYNPHGLAVDSDGNVLVCDMGNNRIQKFTLDGRFVGKTCDVINEPLQIAVLSDGRILVVDDGKDEVRISCHLVTTK